MNKVILIAIFFVVGCDQNKGGFAPHNLETLDPRSCADLQQIYSRSGVYKIDPDGTSGVLSSIYVYCDMTTMGGGWTLVIKQKSNDGTTLQGDSVYWTNSEQSSLNDDVSNLNTLDENLVSAAFYKIPVSKMMLVASNETSVKFHDILATSAFHVFSQPTSDFSDDANQLRPNWNIKSTTYPNGVPITGARFGLNIRQMVINSNYCAVRWGWTANQDVAGYAPGSSDSCGGLGAYGTQYGSSYMSHSKSSWQPATLLLYVK
jgi:Fibrinogen beta and gamma chains, C-terminal globular domain